MPMAGEQQTPPEDMKPPEDLKPPEDMKPPEDLKPPEDMKPPEDLTPEEVPTEKCLVIYRNGMEITDEQRIANGVVGVKLWPGMRLYI